MHMMNGMVTEKNPAAYAHEPRPDWDPETASPELMRAISLSIFSVTIVVAILHYMK